MAIAATIRTAATANVILMLVATASGCAMTPRCPWVNPRHDDGVVGRLVASFGPDLIARFGAEAPGVRFVQELDKASRAATPWRDRTSRRPGRRTWRGRVPRLSGPPAGAWPRNCKCGWQEWKRSAEPMLMLILVIFLFVALAGGGLGYSRFGYAGLSPAALIVLILLVLVLTGHRF
jgi:hypothetical protein